MVFAGGAAAAAKKKQGEGHYSPKGPVASDSEQDDDEETPLLGEEGGPPGPKLKVTQPIALREDAKLDAERTGEVLLVDEVVTAKHIVTVDGDDNAKYWDHIPIEGSCFVDIGDGRGWALNKNLVTNDFLLEAEPEADENMARFNLRKFFQTKTYERSIALIIVINAFIIGAEIDHPHSLPHVAWLVINIVVSAIYVTEISLKMFAFGPYFFESSWNIFDLTVTSLTLLGDLLPLFMTVADIRAQVCILRLLRLLRLTNMFQDLRTLMRAFMGSVASLAWITGFIMLWFYICACLTTIIVGRKDWFPDSSATTPKDAQVIRAMFDTIPHSMYSLWEVMILEGWCGVIRPIYRQRPGLMFFFFFFIFVSGFFALNLFTAVVVDQTMEAQNAEEASKEAACSDRKQKILANLQAELMKRSDGRDVVSRKDLSKWLQDPSSKSRLKKVEWDPEAVDHVCTIIDKNRTGTVSLTELIVYISGTHTDKGLDMHSLIRVTGELLARLEKDEVLLSQLVGAPKSGQHTPGDRTPPAGQRTPPNV